MAFTSPISWQAIAEQASIEMDSEKLMTLVTQLCNVMDTDDEKKQGKFTPPPQTD